jgi:hypothetical protein
MHSGRRKSQLTDECMYVCMYVCMFVYVRTNIELYLYRGYFMCRQSHAYPNALRMTVECKQRISH